MTEQQIKLQEAIMLACHPWFTIDQIKEKQKYCNPKTKVNWNFVEIAFISIPPTLSRILTALWENYIYWLGAVYEAYYRSRDSYWLELDYDYFQIWKYKESNPIFLWKLLNDDWSDATLFDQTQETQDMVYSIICSQWK